MATVVLDMFSRRAKRVVSIAREVLLTAAGQFIAELCASSQALDDKRQIAVLKRQLSTTSAAAGRWHLRALEYQAMLDIRDGETVELPDVETLHVKQFN